MSKTRIKGKSPDKEYWEITICNKRNLEKFAKYIGFELDSKIRKLHNAINSYKSFITPSSESLEIYLNHIEQHILEKGHSFLPNDLAKSMKITNRQANYILKRLKDKGFLRPVRIIKVRGVSKRIVFNKQRNAILLKDWL